MVEKSKFYLKSGRQRGWQRLRQLHRQQQQQQRECLLQDSLHPNTFEEVGSSLTELSICGVAPGLFTGAIRQQLRTAQPHAIVQLRHAEYHRKLLTHPYTDVDHIRLNHNCISSSGEEVNTVKTAVATMASDKESSEAKPLNSNNNNNGSSNGNGNAQNSKPKIQPKYSIHRDVLTHDFVIKQTGYAARDKSIPSALRGCWQSWSFFSLFTGIIPILQWLPQYSLKRDLVGDIIAGFTVAIMNVPHGMAYGLLAGVSAGNGLYMAVFPVLVYMVLGTSRHISIGTFAVASMMTLKVVQTYATVETLPLAPIYATPNSTTMLANATATVAPFAADDVITHLEVVTSLALTVGIVHLLMSFFRLGTLASLLSDPLVNGFTTAAACHVVTAQLKDVLGISIPRYKGAFKIIYTLIDIAKSVPQTNLMNFGFCVGVIIFMTICNECLKPCMRKRCRFPLPAELIAVIGGTLLSRFLHMHDNFGVQLVGVIPRGLPEPTIPRLDLVPKVAVDSIAIAIVTYSIVMSMGLTFAKKHSYEVRANQELFAMGVGNIVSGCFACIPMACSLSRSVIQDQTGGVSQIASLVSASLVVVTLMWVGPFFSDLPRCVLAGVIIVALKPMFMQAKELKKFSKQGKLEMFTWISTFVCVVLIDIDIGLLIGVCISLLALYIKGLKPYATLLGYMPEAPGIYVDLNQHRNAMELPDTRIFRYCGSLNFATSMFFRRALNEAIGLDRSSSKNFKTVKTTYTLVAQNGGSGDAPNGRCVRKEVGGSFQFLILDFSMLGHIDVAGCRALSDLSKELKSCGARMLLASPVDRVYDTLVHSMALSEGPFEIFPTLHDTVEYANAFRTA